MTKFSMAVLALVNYIKSLSHKIEMDRAVFFALLSRFWSGSIGLIAMFLIARQFTPELQGYYYTFYNFLAIQVFIEMGFGTVIIQFASHEWSGLKLDDKGSVVGCPDSLSRLVSLARISLTWYLCGGIILFVLLSGAGYFFFSSSQSTDVRWTAPWIILCALTGINIVLTPLWSLLEGCNQVRNLYTYRFFQVMCSGIFLIGAILLGAGLWALCFSVLGTLLCAPIFIWKHYKNFFVTLLFSRPSGPYIKWKDDIFPMQWRIAVSWMSGYFVFCLFTPVLFYYQGPVVAGQFGMTWSLLSILSMISASWLAPKTPQLGMLIAQKKYQDLDRFFWKMTKIVLLLVFLSGLSIMLLVGILNKFYFSLALRLLPPKTTGLLVIAQLLVAFSLPFGVYLRAHKKEPLLFISLASGVLIGTLTFFLGKYYSAAGIVVGYLSANMIIVPIVVVIWYRCREEWHKDVHVDNKIIPNVSVAGNEAA